jgi:hypothetical protein
MHNLKQALHLMHGSTRIFNSLSVDDRSQLWESISTGSRTLYQQVAAEMKGTAENIRNIPVRMVFANGRPTIQKPVPVKFQDDTVVTLESLLGLWYPDLQPRDYDYEDRVFVQGIGIPIDVPIYEIWRLFAHGDLFLYICVR